MVDVSFHPARRHVPAISGKPAEDPWGVPWPGGCPGGVPCPEAGAVLIVDFLTKSGTSSWWVPTSAATAFGPVADCGAVNSHANTKTSGANRPKVRCDGTMTG